MGISNHLKMIGSFLAVSLCLNNFAVLLGQQIRDCGKEYDPTITVPEAAISNPSSDEVQIDKMPWMVSIVKKNEPDVASCSASLVAAKFIVTAAHCFIDDPKEAFEVILGTDSLSQSPSNFQKYQKRMDIAELHVHPNYTGGYYHDFAIIQLSNEVSYEKGIYPISFACLKQKVQLSSQVNK